MGHIFSDYLPCLIFAEVNFKFGEIIGLIISYADI